MGPKDEESIGSITRMKDNIINIVQEIVGRGRAEHCGYRAFKVRDGVGNQSVLLVNRSTMRDEKRWSEDP